LSDAIFAIFLDPKDAHFRVSRTQRNMNRSCRKFMRFIVFRMSANVVAGSGCRSGNSASILILEFSSPRLANFMTLYSPPGACRSPGNGMLHSPSSFPSG